VGAESLKKEVDQGSQMVVTELQSVK